jgi:hypothetical protein
MSSYDSEPDPVGSVTNWPPGSGSGSVIQNYGSVDTVPEEIVKDPQHWILAKVSVLETLHLQRLFLKSRDC